jgi:putative membrane protein insertion efficiency factor
MKIISHILITVIKIYQLLISPYLGNNCRFLPTCSDYFIDCLKTYGLVKGFLKGTKRLLSCHPIKVLGGGQGFDPIIKKIKAKK